MGGITISRVFKPTKRYALVTAGRVKSEELAEKLLRAATADFTALSDTLPAMAITEEEEADIVGTSRHGNDHSYLTFVVKGKMRDFLAILGDVPESFQRMVVEELRRGRTREEEVTITIFTDKMLEEVSRAAGVARKFKVPSSREKGVEYTITVEDGKPVCSCVGFSIRKTCRHVNDPTSWVAI